MTFKQLKEENYKYVVIKVNNEKEENKVINYFKKLQPKAEVGINRFIRNTEYPKYKWLDLHKTTDGNYYYTNIKKGEYLIFETDKNWERNWDIFHKIFKLTITFTTGIKYNKELQ